ncbi:hypothetical protein NDU88_006027 [Pleurodeles waltl]|uniref:Uncharacterized protein n=1 Tax=Pleurodeles waltl TaxID=8319 RepID=A0AAV7TWJ7_PLEWA|nr:hypothetical protein NDU88_006027 [Pleurodeles waltl]
MGLSAAHLIRAWLSGGSGRGPGAAGERVNCLSLRSLDGYSGVCLQGSISMAASGKKSAKRSRTETVLEALRLRMDAIDQAIASLKSQPPEVPMKQVERPRRAGGPPRQAFPRVLKRANGQGKHKGNPFGPALSNQDIRGQGAENQDPSYVSVVPVDLTLSQDAPSTVTVQPVTENALVLPRGWQGGLEPQLQVVLARWQKKAAKIKDYFCNFPYLWYTKNKYNGCSDRTFAFGLAQHLKG